MITQLPHPNSRLLPPHLHTGSRSSTSNGSLTYPSPHPPPHPTTPAYGLEGQHPEWLLDLHPDVVDAEQEERNDHGDGQSVPADLEGGRQAGHVCVWGGQGSWGAGRGWGIKRRKTMIVMGIPAALEGV